MELKHILCKHNISWKLVTLVFDYYVGHLVTCISDQKIILRQIVSTKETKYGNFSGDHKLLISLMEPTIEYTMRCIFKDLNKVRYVDFMTTHNCFRFNCIVNSIVIFTDC